MMTFKIATAGTPVLTLYVWLEPTQGDKPHTWLTMASEFGIRAALSSGHTWADRREAWTQPNHRYARWVAVIDAAVAQLREDANLTDNALTNSR